jgi:hypothetical protein
MKTRVFKTLIILSGLMFGGLIAKESRASIVTFEFTAQVDTSIGTDNFTGGPITVGSTLKGSMTFDSTATDLNPDPHFGTYVYHNPPYTSPIGMIVQQGSNVLQTDAANMAFSIEVTNDILVDPGTADGFSVASLNNLPPPLPPTHSGKVNMDMEMNDSDLGITSDSLPLTPPHLTTGLGTQRLFIHGNDDSSQIFVEANITSITLKTAETTLNDLKTFVETIPPEDFKNPNMSNPLDAKIDAALAMLALIESETDPTTKAQEIADLRDKLTNDLLAKGNGCGSAPDKNDWILDCTVQHDFQAQIQTILDLLNTL